MKDVIDKLSIIHYPAPRLRKACREVAALDEGLAALAERMFTLMRAGGGVGLAAPQVGVLLRLFVTNLTGEPADAMVFVNPVIHDLQGSVEAEEGCLSIPGVNVQVRRAATCQIQALDLSGKPIEMEGQDVGCRIWQHEIDHLNGILILDRMGPSDRIATRKTLKSLEESYNSRAGQ